MRWRVLRRRNRVWEGLLSRLLTRWRAWWWAVWRERREADLDVQHALANCDAAVSRYGAAVDRYRESVNAREARMRAETTP